MVRSGAKNKHQKGVCFKEIGLCAQNMISIPGSIVNIIGGGPSDHLISIRIMNLIMFR